MPKLLDFMPIEHAIKNIGFNPDTYKISDKEHTPELNSPNK
jgi:hypothetical protein